MNGEPVQLSDFARRTYESVRGQTESLFEIWQAYDYIKVVPGPATVMNQVAPSFFGTIHRCMLQCVLVLIRQLMDPAEARVQKTYRRNSSMLGLLDIAFGPSYKTTVPDLVEIAIRAKQAGKVPAEWANKVVAHTDLLIGLDEEDLPPLIWGMVPTAVNIAVEFVHAFEAKCGITAPRFTTSVLSAELIQLVSVLKMGSTV